MKADDEYMDAYRSTRTGDGAGKLAPATAARRFAPASCIEAEARLARLHVHDPCGAVEPCSTCEVRAFSVCNAVPGADLARLAAITVETEALAGQGFIDEGEPATYFFIVTAGTAKLFKLLPDGRRQITGFVGPGQFLGLAVSDTYAFSAEAIDLVRYCRLPRAKLRALLDDFPQMEKLFLEVASNELVAAQEQMLLLGRKTARERLASFLLIQSRQGMPRRPISFFGATRWIARGSPMSEQECWMSMIEPSVHTMLPRSAREIASVRLRISSRQKRPSLTTSAPRSLSSTAMAVHYPFPSV